MKIQQSVVVEILIFRNKRTLKNNDKLTLPKDWPEKNNCLKLKKKTSDLLLLNLKISKKLNPNRRLLKVKKKMCQSNPILPKVKQVQEKKVQFDSR